MKWVNLPQSLKNVYFEKKKLLKYFCPPLENFTSTASVPVEEGQGEDQEEDGGHNQKYVGQAEQAIEL